MFRDRTDAGSRLAEALVASNINADIVLAVPRGGLPVARAVADALDLPLDVIAARKLGAPNNPELAIGSVAADGTVWINDQLVKQVGVSEGYIERTRRAEAAIAQDKLTRYRSGSTPLDLTGQHVLIVDDGIATGATTIACVRAARNAGAASVTLAVPVGPPSSVEILEGEADAVVCLETPRSFGSVGRFYRDFGQVSDEAAIQYLDRE